MKFYITKHRYRNYRGIVFVQGQPVSSTQARCLEECCKLPQRGPGPPKGFLALCAARLSLCPCVDLPVYTCSYACDCTTNRPTWLAPPPSPWAGGTCSLCSQVPTPIYIVDLRHDFETTSKTADLKTKTKTLVQLYCVERPGGWNCWVLTPKHSPPHDGLLSLIW